MQFGECPLPICICSSGQALGFISLGYVRRPFTTITPPEVDMTSLKTRLYSPVLLITVTTLASLGAGFRMG